MHLQKLPAVPVSTQIHVKARTRGNGMNRIASADPDAVTLMAFFVLCLIAGGVFLLAQRMTRSRWPKGHGDSYWSTAKRINEE